MHKQCSSHTHGDPNTDRETHIHASVFLLLPFGDECCDCSFILSDNLDKNAQKGPYFYLKRQKGKPTNIVRQTHLTILALIISCTRSLMGHCGQIHFIGYYIVSTARLKVL